MSPIWGISAQTILHSALSTLTYDTGGSAQYEKITFGAGEIRKLWVKIPQ